jgi:RNA polymerase sigma-70 factor (ECF subfamily)
MECTRIVHRLIFVRNASLNLPDAATVARARQGDPEAFGELFHQTQVRIYNFVRSLVPNPDDAADLTQRVYLTAWKGLKRLRHDGAFLVWLHQIALNAVRDVRKSPAPEWVPLEAEKDSDGAQGPADWADDQPPPDAAVMERDLQAMVRQAIAALPEAHRVVVTLHHLEGLDVKDIAEILNVPPGTVLSRLARARESLRGKLQRVANR